MCKLKRAPENAQVADPLIDEQDPKPSAKEDVEKMLKEEEDVESDSDDEIAIGGIMTMTFALDLTDIIIWDTIMT